MDKNTMPQNKRTYSEKQKAEALAMLALNNDNVAKTARDLKIPRVTLLQWRKMAHVNEDVSKMQQIKQRDISEILREQIYDMLDVLPAKREDASFSDVSRTIGIFIDKLQLLTGNATSRVEVMTFQEVVNEPDDESDSFS